jgi:hypothetical protein
MNWSDLVAWCLYRTRVPWQILCYADPTVSILITPVPSSGDEIMEDMTWTLLALTVVPTVLPH